MFGFIHKSPPKAVYAISILGLLISAGLTKIFSFDIWWHLKTGEFISNTLTIPKHDIFSYTAAGNYWVNFEWLSQVFIWNMGKLVGPPGLSVIKFFAICFICLTIFKTAKLLVRNDIAALWCSFFAVMAIFDRIVMRPFLFSLILLPYFCLQLHRYASHKKKYLWELPFVTIVWINLHGGAVLSPLIVFAYAFGETLHVILTKSLKMTAPPGVGHRKLIQLWIVGILCTLACCATPYGLESITFPFHHVFELSYIVNFTNEWMNPMDPRLDPVTTQILFKLFLVIVPLSYILGIRTIKFPHLAMTILMAVLAMKGRRFTSYFMLVNLPIVFYNLRDLASNVQGLPGTRNTRAWANLCLFAIISCLALGYGVPTGIGGGRFGESGIGLSKREVAPMMRFLIENDIRGRVFNPMELGGKFIFARWPAERVFIDGRTPVYGDVFFRDYILSLHNRRFFEELNRKYEFDYIITSGADAWKRRHMERYFWENPDWKLVYAGQDGFVYLKNIRKFRKIIEANEIRENPLIEEMKRGGMNERNLLY